MENISNDGEGQQPATELLPQVYEQLRRLAEEHMPQEKKGHTLQATALVHEAYARLVGTGEGAKFAKIRLIGTGGGRAARRREVRGAS